MNTEYENRLITEIEALEYENDMLREKLHYVIQERDTYFKENESYRLWMDRSIARIKEMQNG